MLFMIMIYNEYSVWAGTRRNENTIMLFLHRVSTGYSYRT